MTAAGVRAAVLLASRGPVTPACLAMLARWADEHGPETVAAWVDDDPGLTWMRTDEWWSYRVARGAR